MRQTANLRIHPGWNWAHSPPRSTRPQCPSITPLTMAPRRSWWMRRTACRCRRPMPRCRCRCPRIPGPACFPPPNRLSPRVDSHNLPCPPRCLLQHPLPGGNRRPVVPRLAERSPTRIAARCVYTMKRTRLPNRQISEVSKNISDLTLSG